MRILGSISRVTSTVTSLAQRRPRLCGSRGIVTSNELTQFVFGQQHVKTKEFFASRHGQYHSITLDAFPHYQFLDRYLDVATELHPYSEYLESSWEYYHPQNNTPAIRRQKTQEFAAFYRRVKDQCRRNPFPMDPIIVCKRPDGKRIIVDGNHRASIALKLGLDLQVEEIDPATYLSYVVRVPGQFFGTKRLGRPYQSIFSDGKEVVVGRRRDVFERMQKIRPKDIQGKSVLDLGCNIGMSALLAAEAGAQDVIGIEISDRITTAAMRVNTYFARPVDFVCADLSEPLTKVSGRDTVFCFSVVAHVENTERLFDTLRNLTRHVLYFEGHAGSDLADYEAILRRLGFSNLELLGYGRDGCHTDRRSRPLIRCQVTK